MAVREGTISEDAKRRLIDASREIVKDVKEDGGTKKDAVKFIGKLILKAIK